MKQAKFAEEVIEDSALFDGSQNNDSFIYLMGVLKGLSHVQAAASAMTSMYSVPVREQELAKLSFRRLLPDPPSMPGKINPYMPELLLQIMQQIISHDMMATLTVNESDLGSLLFNLRQFLRSNGVSRTH